MDGGGCGGVRSTLVPGRCDRRDGGDHDRPGTVFAGLRLWADSLVAPAMAHMATNSLEHLAALIALEEL